MTARAFLTIALLASGLASCGGEARDGKTSGAALYAANCAVCHGADGRGGGGGGVAGLSKTPPDLTLLAQRNGGDFPAYQALEVLEGYAAGGLRGRQMSGFQDLQGEERKRVRLKGARLRTTKPLADLLVYLAAQQQP